MALTWNDVVAEMKAVSEGGFIATVGDDGRPHLAWVSFGHRDDGTIVLTTFRSSRKGRNLLAAAGGPVAVHLPEGNHPQIFLRAEARLVTDPVEQQALWEAKLLPYDPAMFFGTWDNPEVLFVVLTPTYASVQRALGQAPEVWRRDARASAG